MKPELQWSLKIIFHPMAQTIAIFKDGENKQLVRDI
jgi:hypothetical protein